jgi:hypothetical protein
MTVMGLRVIAWEMMREGPIWLEVSQATRQAADARRDNARQRREAGG